MSIWTEKSFLYKPNKPYWDVAVLYLQIVKRKLLVEFQEDLNQAYRIKLQDLNQIYYLGAEDSWIWNDQEVVHERFILDLDKVKLIEQ